MALADPQSVTSTILGGAVSLPRTSFDKDGGSFGDVDGQLFFTVRHSRGNRNRHTIKLQRNVVGADPLVPAINREASLSVHLVIDTPNGLGVADNNDALDLVMAFGTWLSASSYANVTKVLGGQS